MTKDRLDVPDKVRYIEPVRHPPSAISGSASMRKAFCSEVATAFLAVDACLRGEVLWRMADGGWPMADLMAVLCDAPEEQNNHDRVKLEAADDHQYREEHFRGGG